MDSKINAINFGGKKEVLYGLKKAAQKAKNIEYYSQPSIASRMNGSAQTYTSNQNAAMQAYLDMALRDEVFSQTIQEIKVSELYELHALLMPEITQHSCVRPFNRFKEVINQTVNVIGGIKNATVKASVEKLLNDLKL